MSPAITIPPRFPCTDSGNAERFAAQHRHEARYVSTWKTWMVSDGKRWRRDDRGAVEQMSKATARSIDNEVRLEVDDDRRKQLRTWAAKSEARGGREAMIALARGELAASPDDFDRDPWLFNVENGTIDLRTGALRPHDPDDMLTKLAPAAFDPKATAPLWDAFLSRVMNGNAELISYLQRLVGYSLAGVTSEHVLVFSWGGGDNGNEWFERYYAAAERGAVGSKNRGKPQASVDDRRARFRTWISPVIGTLEMRAVAAADLRRVVQKLDEQVMARTAFYLADEGDERKGRKPGMSAKTAKNVFGEVTSGFAEAVHSKIDDLRVLERNPADGVRGPMTTDEREQAALYPVETVALLSCEDIPASRRRVYFAALYTGMRRSELERLDAECIDLEHDLITVRGKKSAAARRQVPIEPALRPLLVSLVAARPYGPLLDVPRADGKGGSSDLLKRDCERARLDRADLWRDDAQNMPFTFHGLRHTCITHWAIAGRAQTWLLVVAGHTDAEMTRRYLDKAAVVRGRFGTPHPPIIVDSLLETKCQELAEVPRAHKRKERNPEEFRSVLTSPLATPAGIEPALPA